MSMSEERIDEIVNQIILNLDGHINSNIGDDFFKEPFFKFFAELYKDFGSEIVHTIMARLYEEWIEKRHKLLNQLDETWQDWAYALDNID